MSRIVTIQCPECPANWTQYPHGNEGPTVRSQFLAHYRQVHVAPEHPHYTSTYCIHDHHDQCRLTCKICADPCKCHCHEVI